uniref:gamma-aminobutyric acid type B receptor subunit 1 n=1 Tax=Ciona intestinalis TaxID=7719 RepID=UPI000180B959|nr:gamma-aminobutyric acid type B receptor subunit 1 [Ciona intestinalis]|eukprot:XP_002127474.1 gamma-aminobutyric acid type B receptor subunit 1 [Ciona intestinalis]
MKYTIIWLLAAVLSSISLSVATTDIFVGGIFPMSGGWSGGQACYPAAQMAVEDVNNRSDILQGYKINLVKKDSKCDAGLGTRKFYDLLQDSRIFTLLTGCSSVSTPIAESAYLWNINVMAYGASSPALSNRSRFPSFFRTHPSANLHNPTRIKLFQMFGWKRIGIISQGSEVFESTAKDLRTRLIQENMEIVTQQSFHADPKVAVQNLKKVDVRIIVGLFYEGAARKVMCEAFKEKLFGNRYVWFLIGWYKHGWHIVPEKGVDCTEDEMADTVEGHFTTEILMLNPTNDTTVSGMNTQEFLQRLSNTTTDIHLKGGYEEAPLAYDAIWAIAIALNNSIQRLQTSDLTRNNGLILNDMYRSLNASSFTGISGTVVFDSDGSRMAWTKVERMENGVYKEILIYHAEKKIMKRINKINWKQPPKDRTMTVKRTLKLSTSAFVAGGAMAAMCGFFCVACLCFTWKERNNKLIIPPGSSLNSISLFGFLLLISAIFLSGLNDITGPICEVRAWTLSIGFTLAFSPLFAKLWTVNDLHKKMIFDGRSTKKKKKDVKVNFTLNTETVVVMVVPLVLDLIVLITWSCIDRLVQSKSKLAPYEEGEVIINPELKKCVSNYTTIWIGVMFAYKAIQLLLGSFLAYESRSKIESNSDHKTVAGAVYNITVLSLLCAPILMILGDEPNLSFLFLATPINMCTITSTAIIFIPKWRVSRKKPEFRRTGSNRSAVQRVRPPASNHIESEEQKLERENRILQEKIAEKNKQINELRQRKIATENMSNGIQELTPQGQDCE